MDHPFRSSAFGGFNRQDVLTYLENTAREAAQQQQALEEKLNEAQETAARQDADLTERQGQIARLRQENEALRAQLEQANTALSAKSAECSRAAGELEGLRRELEELKADAASLQPDARAYRELKERTAGVELEAHRRAQAIQEKAEGDARQLRRQMEQWMQKVAREYEALRGQVESTVSHAADQLDRAGKDLARVTQLVGEQDLALESLAQAYADTDPAKVAAPMPIPEQE